MPLLRRLRAIVVTAGLFAVVWSLFAMLFFYVVARLTHVWGDQLSHAMLGGYGVFGLLFGAIGGALFAAIFALVERRRSIAGLSVPRAALWGLIGGSVVPWGLIASRVIAFGAAQLDAGTLLILGVNGLVGASLAGGAVAIARKGRASAGELDAVRTARLAPEGQ